MQSEKGGSFIKQVVTGNTHSENGQSKITHLKIRMVACVMH